MDEVERATREALKVDFDNIPDELKEGSQFVNWNYELVEEDLKKPPFDPKTGRGASVRNPNTWESFDETRRAYETGKYAGIGYMLTGGLVAFDIDHCIKDGQLDGFTKRLIAYLGTYFEKSPSGTGARGFIRGHKPGLLSRSGNIEVYEQARYVTLTGHRISSERGIISDQKKLDYVYRKIFERQPQEKSQEDRRLYRQQNIAYEKLIKKAIGAKNGSLFERHWNGDHSLWEGKGAIHRSQSEADFRLVLYLLYWTNGDTKKTDELFRMSLLMRPKWDRPTQGDKTYGEGVIEKALSFYLAGRNR